MASKHRLPRGAATLRKTALAFPEAYEEMPWLPSSRDVALHLPFATPIGYGLGRSGWVTARFARNAKLPIQVLKLWIEESYRAVAPKRLVAQVGS